MNQRILVALKTHNQVNEALSCVEEVMKPGMKVVFLLPYRDCYHHCPELFIKVINLPSLLSRRLKP